MSRRLDYRIGAALSVGILFADIGDLYAQCQSRELAELIPSGAETETRVGFSVAIEGDVLLFGAPGDDECGIDAGAIYVFTRHNGNWIESDKLLPAGDQDPDGDGFGVVIAVDGTTAVIGAPRDDEPGTGAGSAYVVVKNGGDWEQQAKLMADDASADDWFGLHVAVDGDTILVGAFKEDNENGVDAGAAYVFVRSDGDWTQQAKLIAPDGQPGDNFGRVAVADDVAVVGADQHGLHNGTRSGSAYVFTRSGDLWTFQQEIYPDDGAPFDEFASGVSLSGHRVLIGANTDDENGFWNCGSAYVYHFDGSDWVKEAKLLASDPDSNDEFASNVSLDGDLAVIGAKWCDDVGEDSGKSYVFRLNGTTWVEETWLLPNEAAPGDEFGFAVAISDFTAVVGAHLNDSVSTDSGAAYVFGSLDDCNVNGQLDI
jgi:hypothetical protein